MNIKINQKSYKVPQLGFRHMVYMEDMGFSVIEILQKKQVFTIAAAFVGVVAKCDREEAELLCEQHIAGGGSLNDVYAGFMGAINESGFFKKLFKEEEALSGETEPTVKKTTPRKAAPKKA